ncbi:hypothetical protein ACP4OV_010256 [Aristida adscensionis]
MNPEVQHRNQLFDFMPLPNERHILYPTSCTEHGSLGSLGDGHMGISLVAWLLGDRHVAVHVLIHNITQSLPI